MTSKKEIWFLIQVALPFILLTWWKSYYFIIPVAFILTSLPFSLFRKKIISWWQTLGKFLGLIVSPVVLSGIYYLVLTPLAFLRRLGASDPLTLEKPLESTLRAVSTENVPENFEDLW